ncbi:MAG: repeat containing protein, partial [Bryobacterales bacterium]|nr:repeat containing protein [Bryobacterales bacterium]
ASDGVHFAVADTDNNRVLIWNSIPNQGALSNPLYNQPADIVIGQPDFTHDVPAVPPTAKSMRGPSGLWFQNGKLFVADTQNNRVLIYNSIPTANGAAADVVLGQPSFTSAISPTQLVPTPAANNLLSPVSVTSDGQRLYVSDLGDNRVLIWNSIPTTNQAPADVVLGQPNFTSFTDNNSPGLCASNGTDTSNNPTYPARCSKTLSFPRFALSDGHRLFIADGGNDRVLIFSTIPTSNSTAPDIILGEPDEFTDNPGDGADQFQTPTSLAWDGTNLYVSDVFNRRVVAYSPGDVRIPQSGIRNAASLEVFALGSVSLGGTITEKDTVTVTIALGDGIGNTVNTKDYTYTVAKTDTLADIVNGLVALINKAPGDPNATARPDIAADGTLFAIILTAKIGGAPGTLVNTSATVSTSATETATANQTSLQLNLQDAAELAPGSLVTVFGSNLAYGNATASLSVPNLPTTLAQTQVYIDGIPAPLLSVAPDQINVQMPFEVNNRSNVSIYVRTLRSDGSVQISTPEAVPIVLANPGIFAEAGADPRAGKVYHAYANATGAISVDGTISAGDVGTISIVTTDGTTLTYAYTVQASDTLNTVQQAFVNAINNDPNSPVTAVPSNVFTRILLIAKVSGTGPQAVTYSVSVTKGTGLILTALTSQLCCANTGDARVTTDNPAAPGEVVYVYATGLGPSQSESVDTGAITTAANLNDPPVTPVDSILAGGATANIISTNYVPGLVGIYQVQFQLSSSLTSNPQTQLTIAQQNFVSNVVTFPVAVPSTTP